jgi:hypothetical protein
MADGETEANLRCPECGDKEIVEWNNVPSRAEMEKVILDDKGEIVIIYTGASEPVWDLSEVTGYACKNFCFEGPIEDFIVKQ